MTAPARIWRFVRHAYRSLYCGAPVWRVEMECGHQQWRNLREQKRKPVRLVCETCERERDAALRPEWMRGAA